MIADANIIAAGLFLLPLAMISRRPGGTQNRGRAGSMSGSSGGIPSGSVLDRSNGASVLDRSNGSTVLDRTI
jgi:hypothetical protein